MTEAAAAINEQEIRERFAGYGDAVEGGTPEDALQQALSIPYPPNLPAFEWLHMDSEGNIWVGHRLYGTDGEREEAFVFGKRRDGFSVSSGCLRVSRCFRSGLDFILGHATDDLGVHYVHRYRIEK